MKFPLFASALMLALVSCSKSTDEPAPVSAPTLVGTWQFVSETTIATPLNGGADIMSTGPYGPVTVLLTFKPAAIGQAQYTVGGQPATPQPYTYDGDVLTINEPNYVSVYRVTKLTATELAFSKTTTDVSYRVVTTENLVRVP